MTITAIPSRFVARFARTIRRLPSGATVQSFSCSGLRGCRIEGR
jgi:hypothetical protein